MGASRGRNARLCTCDRAHKNRDARTLVRTIAGSLRLRARARAQRRGAARRRRRGARQSRLSAARRKGFRIRSHLRALRYRRCENFWRNGREAEAAHQSSGASFPSPVQNLFSVRLGTRVDGAGLTETQNQRDEDEDLPNLLTKSVRDEALHQKATPYPLPSCCPLVLLPLASCPLASCLLSSCPLASCPLASCPLTSCPLASCPLASCLLPLVLLPLALLPLCPLTSRLFALLPLASLSWRSGERACPPR